MFLKSYSNSKNQIVVLQNLDIVGKQTEFLQMENKAIFKRVHSFRLFSKLTKRKEGC